MHQTMGPATYHGRVQTPLPDINPIFQSVLDWNKLPLNTEQVLMLKYQVMDG